MKPNPKGKDGEDFAADILRGKGYAILCRNFHSRYGEVDIIAQKGGVIAFVEVKTRKRGGMTTGLEAVTYGKRRKIIMTAQYYLLMKPMSRDLQPRFDVISITMGVSGRNTSTEYIHLEGAFDYNG